MTTTTIRNQSPAGAFRQLLGRLFVVASVLGFLSAAKAQSGTEGSVSGIVSNSKTGVALEGAEVDLTTSAGASAGTTFSERGGAFTITHVPAGQYTLHVSYTGLDPYSATVMVNAGQNSTMQVGLTSEIYKMEAFSVQGLREGNAAAITQQKNAPNIVDILSIDAYGDVADSNIANMLQNEPGVAVFQQAGGDDVGISVGGAPVELTTINVNGTRMASALVGSSGGMGDRSQFIDRVPSDFIQKIEITMGTTPDQMDDSLAGAVNLVTKSGLDVTENVFTYRMGVTHNDYIKALNHKFRPTGELSYLGAFGKDRQFGVSLGASYSAVLNPSQNINTSHSNVNDARASGARMLNDLDERRREGLQGQVDYKFQHDTAHVWLAGMLNFYVFKNERINWQASASNQNFADYSVVSYSAISAGAQPKTTAGAVAGLAPGLDPNVQTILLDPTVTNDAEHEDRRAHQYTISGGFTKDWGDNKFTFNASWNPTSFDDDFYGMTVNYNNIPVGILVDSRIDALLPHYSQVFGPSLSAGGPTYGAPWFATWFKQPDTERQTVSDFRGDFEHKNHLFGVPNTWKAGLEYRDETNWFINTYRPVYNFTGSLSTVMPWILNDPSTSRGVFNNAIPTFVWDTINFTKAKALFNLYPQFWTPSGTTVGTPPIGHDFAEFVNAGYLMDTMQIGKLNVLLGVRYEHTTVEGQGTYTDPNFPSQKIITVARAYENKFPSVHLKYDFNKHLVMKFSYSTSSARPNYSSIVPNTTVNNSATSSGYPGTVTQANPGLLPDYGVSWEGAVEYYFEPAGLISFSYFYRKITNFQVSSSVVIPTGTSNGFNGLYGGYLLSTSSNLTSPAYDEGYEIHYIQQFPWLPKPFNGLQAFADTTIQKSHGNFANGASELPFFTPRTSNIGGVFTYKKLTARFTWHDHSYYLQSFSTNPAAKTYVGDIPQEDAQIEYAFSPRYKIFIDGANIRDMGLTQFNVNWYTRNTQIQDNGRHIDMGISGRF
jgi:TonB-dependent receptor